MRIMLTLLLLILTPFMALGQPDIRSIHYYDAHNGFDAIYDVYAATGDRLAMCGWTGPVNNGSGVWLIYATNNGDLIWQRTYCSDRNPTSDIAYSVIELDGGGFVLGGRSGPTGRLPISFGVLRVDEEGEPVWWNVYNEEHSNLGNCYAVIEAKSGNVLCAGQAIVENSMPQAYAVMVNLNGEVIWERYYGETGQFYAVKEVADTGFLFAGRDGNNANHGWLLMTNMDGEVVWSHTFAPGTRGLVSSPAGGYAAAGTSRGSWSILRVNREGNEIWSSSYDLEGRNDMSTSCSSIAAMADGGFVIAGVAGDNIPLVVRTDADGNEMWRRYDHFGFRAGGGISEEYNGVITGEDDRVIVVGKVYNSEMGNYDGLLAVIDPEESGPDIVRWSPVDIDLTQLQGDWQAFKVWARDIQGDSIRYLWTMNGDTISTLDSVSIEFDSLGQDNVKCIVSDEALGDSVIWHVTVTDLFIASSSPDTRSLALRRGTSQTFSLDSVAAVEGDSVEYQWTLTNLDNFEREETGTESSATVEFLRSGNYQMEGLAYRGESSDNVIWTVQVRGAIYDFWPRSLQLAVAPDSAVNFGVIPYNPQPDSIGYAWYLNQDLIGMDSTVQWRFTLDEFGGPTSYIISAIVVDGAEVDTVRWVVNVVPPDGVGKGTSGQVDKWGLLSASPNPFNNSTTIRFAVPSASSSSSTSAQSPSSAVNLTLHDLTGREVRKCVSDELQAGEHSYILNGADLPAGIYLLKLKVGNSHKVAKVAIVR